MAEAAGLGIGVVGLAGLLGTVRDIKEGIDSYKNFDLESPPRHAQRDATEALYHRWSKSVGYDDGRLQDSHHENLDNPEVFELVQRITQSIHAITSTEKKHLPSTTPPLRPPAPQLRDPSFHTRERAQLENAKGAASRKSKASWAFSGKKKISDHNELVASLLQSLQQLVPPSQLNNQSWTQLTLDVDELEAFLEKIIRKVHQEKDEKHRNDEFKRNLSSWLGTNWTSATYDNFVQRRLDGTCDWILRRSEFLNWESTDSELPKALWIHGPAGYGKTVLCARVVEHLKTSFGSPLAYYFFSSESESRSEPFIIIRSWVFQIINQHGKAFELGRERWDATSVRPTLPLEDVKDLFTAIVRNLPGCVFILDGLDECAATGYDGKAEHRDCLADFLVFLRQSVSNTQSRLIIVSRNEPEIRDGLYAEASHARWDLTEFQIRPADVKPDATRFSRRIVDRKLSNKTEAQREELSHRIVEQFESMFQCIRTLEVQLRGGKSQAQLHRIIDQAPTRLTDLYDQTWKRLHQLPDADRDRALAILRWTTFGLRPMTILEITGALLLIEEETDDLPIEELPDEIDDIYIRTEILDLCGSLIETRGTDPDPASFTVHLAHFSVRQYILCHLLAPGNNLLLNEQLRSSNEAVQNNILAKACVQYLDHRQVWGQIEFQTRSRIIQAFRNYAICHGSNQTSTSLGARTGARTIATPV